MGVLEHRQLIILMNHDKPDVLLRVGTGILATKYFCGKCQITYLHVVSMQQKI